MDDLQQGRAVSRRYRNRRIGEFLKELDLAEGRSTGVPKILRAMRANGSPPPSFESDEDRTWFLTRLPAHEDVDVGTTDHDSGQDTEQDKQLENKENSIEKDQDRDHDTDHDDATTDHDTDHDHANTDHDTDHDAGRTSEPVRTLLAALDGEMSRPEMQAALQLKHRRHFMTVYLQPALRAELIEMTLPDKPNSRHQRYRRTPAGEALARRLEESGK